MILTLIAENLSLVALIYFAKGYKKWTRAFLVLPVLYIASCPLLTYSMTNFLNKNGNIDKRNIDTVIKQLVVQYIRNHLFPYDPCQSGVRRIDHSF